MAYLTAAHVYTRTVQVYDTYCMCLHIACVYMLTTDVSMLQAQSVTVWRQANSYVIPRVAFMNKMDKNNAKQVLLV